jgi:hypothetical protein
MIAELHIYRVDVCSSLAGEGDAWVVLAHDKDEAVALLKKHYNEIERKIESVDSVEKIDLEKSDAEILFGSLG